MSKRVCLAYGYWLFPIPSEATGEMKDLIYRRNSLNIERRRTFLTGSEKKFVK